MHFPLRCCTCVFTADKEGLAIFDLLFEKKAFLKANVLTWHLGNGHLIGQFKKKLSGYQGIYIDLPVKYYFKKTAYRVFRICL